MVNNITPPTDGQEPQPINEDGTTLLTDPGKQQEPEPQPGEVKTDEGNPGEGEQDGKKEDGENKKPELPDTYEIKLQDGFTISHEQQAEVDTMFKDMGLTAEQGQRLADYYMSKMKAEQDAVTAEYQKRQEAEVAAAKADTEIGGTSLNESLGFARQAMDKFGGETFRRELEAHGMGNNVEMIRLLARVGRAMQGALLSLDPTADRAKTVPTSSIRI